MTFQFFAVGYPAPQGSKRHVGNGRFIEASKKLAPWRAAVADSAFKAWSESGLPQFTEPVVVVVVFVLPRPKTVKALWPVSRYNGDLDKLCRSVGDALSVDSAVLADDSLIVRWDAVKVYAAPGARCGAWVSVREASDSDADYFASFVTL